APARNGRGRGGPRRGEPAGAAEDLGRKARRIWPRESNRTRTNGRGSWGGEGGDRHAQHRADELRRRPLDVEPPFKNGNGPVQGPPAAPREGPEDVPPPRPPPLPPCGRPPRGPRPGRPPAPPPPPHGSRPPARSRSRPPGHPPASGRC